MKKIKHFLRRYWKILLPVTVLVLAAVITAVLIFTSSSYRLKQALNPKNQKYQNVQVKITQTFRDRSVEAEEDIELVTYLNKDGSSYQESYSDQDIYYYMRDGVEYTLYCDNPYGLKEKGDWTEIPTDTTNRKKAFDFEILKEIEPKRLEKAGEEYRPIDEYGHEVFYNLLDIHEGNYKKYMLYSITFGIEGSSLEYIHMNYIYDNKYHVTHNYEFTYEEKSLKLPKVDIPYVSEERGN